MPSLSLSILTQFEDVALGGLRLRDRIGRAGIQSGHLGGAVHAGRAAAKQLALAVLDGELRAAHWLACDGTRIYTMEMCCPRPSN